MTTLVRPLLIAGLACVPAHAFSAGSLLRIACEGADAGAEVSINGQFKGECPLDIQVNEGIVQLRVLKKVDASRERVFEQQFRIGDGVVKKVEVALSAPRLNAEAQRRENERIAAERAEAMRREQARQLARAAEEQADRESLEQQRKAAESRDTAAMIALSERYAAGKGVPKSDTEAVAWLRKAAAAGSALAAFRLSPLFKAANNEDIADLKRVLAFPVDAERTVNAVGDDAIRALVASDPYFQTPGGNDRIAYTFETRFPQRPDAPMRSEMSCVRDGPSFRTTFENNYSAAGHYVGTVGGLFTFASATRNTGLFASGGTEQSVASIEFLSGRPFPMSAGNRFGIIYTTAFKIGEQRLSMRTFTTCGVVGEPAAIPNIQGARGWPLVCMQQNGDNSFVFRTYWHEPSGCFVMVDRK
ncbi:MAG: hypothetical protein ACM3SS_16810 [Rhodospirillaceae bacterium]